MLRRTKIFIFQFYANCNSCGKEVFLDILTAVQSIKKLPDILVNPKINNHAPEFLIRDLILSQLNPVHDLALYLFMMCINIIIPPIPRYSK
jgi:hypothetical protein